MRTALRARRTKQERLWDGRFGNEYTERQRLTGANTYAFFARALHCIPWRSVSTVLEFGANEGHNLEVLKASLMMTIDGRYFDGVEINARAYVELQKVTDSAWHDSICTFKTTMQWDLTLSKGLLIHLHPDDLPDAYQALYTTSKRYILVAEYYNATPVAIEYRGEKEALWKRDFGGAMLDTFPDLQCLDYGFVWSREEYPQDNLTWWLFEKGVRDERQASTPNIISANSGDGSPVSSA